MKFSFILCCSCGLLFFLFSIQATLNDLLRPDWLFKQVGIWSRSSRVPFGLAGWTCSTATIIDRFCLFTSPHREIFKITVSLCLRCWTFLQGAASRWSRRDYFAFVRLCRLSTLLRGLSRPLISRLELCSLRLALLLLRWLAWRFFWIGVHTLYDD